MVTSIIPVYSSRGDALAFLKYPYLYNQNGEWIGFISPQREVYSVLGYFIGILTSDPRIIRKRSGEQKPRIQPLQKPNHIRITAVIPLPKMMPDLSNENIDVLQEEPELLHTLDAGEFRQDLD